MNGIVFIDLGDTWVRMDQIDAITPLRAGRGCDVSLCSGLTVTARLTAQEILTKISEVMEAL